MLPGGLIATNASVHPPNVSRLSSKYVCRSWIPSIPDSLWFRQISEISRGTPSARMCDFIVLRRSCDVERRTAGLSASSQ